MLQILAIKVARLRAALFFFSRSKAASLSRSLQVDSRRCLALQFNPELPMLLKFTAMHTLCQEVRRRVVLGQTTVEEVVWVTQ